MSIDTMSLLSHDGTAVKMHEDKMNKLDGRFHRQRIETATIDDTAAARSEAYSNGDGT